MTRHPAKFSNSILEMMAELLADVSGTVLDPFAGTGKIHLLSRPDLRTVGVEIEPEWATLDPRTLVGDALSLPLKNSSVDAVATSPTYGNRMADHHNAKDSSKRNTYKHALGRDLHPANSGAMQWGEEYRTFHTATSRELLRVLKPGGVFILNMSNHIRKGKEIPVVEWWLEMLQANGWELTDVRTVATKRYREGSNSHLRVQGEVIAVLKPET